MYAEADGAVRTAKGSADAVRRLLKEGLRKGVRGVRVGPSEAGPFEPLAAHPEFRDLAVGTAAPRPRPPSIAENPPAPERAATPRPARVARPGAPPPWAILPEQRGAGGAGAGLAWVASAVLAAGAFALGLYFLRP